MEWKGREQSGNFEDRRGSSSGRPSMGGKTMLGGGLGGIGLILVIAYVLFTGDTSMIDDMMGGGQSPSGNNQVTHDGSNSENLSEQDKEREEFLRVVLNDTEVIWSDIFKQNNEQYDPTTLVLYTNNVASGCGNASSQMGPFYCPADEKIYIDTSFMDQLSDQFGAKGDFAMAYVLAHEVGHHIQRLTGYTDAVHGKRNSLPEKEYNKYSVALELQADFYAGIYAHYSDEKLGVVEEGDIEEAMNAAHAVGDDTIQEKHMGEADPDSFTHGTSEQRMKWFMKGYKTGDISQGDVFKAHDLKL